MNKDIKVTQFSKIKKLEKDNLKTNRPKKQKG
jgi:hypothetical protein